MVCQSCRRSVQTKYFEFYQNIGMLVMRQMRSIRGNLCKRCARKHGWGLTGMTMLTGWWGTISFVINPFLIGNNLIRLCGTIGMQDGPDNAPPPVMGSAGTTTFIQAPPPQPTFINATTVASTTAPPPVLVQPPMAARPPVQSPPPAATPARPVSGNTQAALGPFAPDIRARLAGGQTPAQVGAYYAPRVGVSPQQATLFVQSLDSK